MSYVDARYISAAVEAAAVALLWQATDAGDGGDGFPIGDNEDGVVSGSGARYVQRVIDRVPYFTEAVTAFMTANAGLLEQGRVTAEQAGHDLILTANGHGAGFWDRGLDMPANDAEALAAYMQGPALYASYLDIRRVTGDRAPVQSVGDALTEACRGYSFDAEFTLGPRGAVTWLMVENTVIVGRADLH